MEYTSTLNTIREEAFLLFKNFVGNLLSLNKRSYQTVGLRRSNKLENTSCSKVEILYRSNGIVI